MLTIGPYKLTSSLLLAPMAGVSDAPFRQMCQNFGAGLTTSEMITSNSDLWSTNKSRLRLVKTENLSVPNSIQIVGSEADIMADAARKCADNGVQLIDINMGCPAKKVCNKAAGSSLLKDEKLVAEILSAVVSAVNIPVTLKIRTGWDINNKNALNIAKIAESEGIKALAIHGRTRACRFNGHAEYDTIAHVKQNVSIPIIANGDITNTEKALAVLQYTKADGLMIGRGAQGQPWIFEEILRALKGDALNGDTLHEKKIQTLSFENKIAFMHEHINSLHEFYGNTLGIKIARKHVSWYLEKLEINNEYRKKFNQIENVSLQLSFISQLQNYKLKGIAA